MIKYVIILIVIFIVSFATTKAFSLSEMQQEINEQKKLQAEALNELNISDTTDTINTAKIFKGGQTSQQALNPEISIVSDFYAKRNLQPNGSNSEQNIRHIGFHFQSDLDPFSKAFIAFGVDTSSTELGEAFIDYTNLFPNVTLRVGKFLQNFGVINRWHVPSMDQWDNPLAPVTLFGGKINQIGFSFHWITPKLFASSNELILKITNAQNTILFHETVTQPTPAALLRFVSYFDLNKDCYINLGFSGITGKNNEYKVEENRNTYAGGIDLTFLYEPVSKARYQSFLWRSELYYVEKEFSDSGLIKTNYGHGYYSYIEAKLNDRFNVGVRYDFVSSMEGKNHTHQYVPYVTFWQSPWVRTRLQYNYKKIVTQNPTQSVLLQLTWAMGPHKHERY